MVKLKVHPLNVAVQAGKLKSYFPDSKVIIRPSRLIWLYSLTPTALSPSYKVKIEYRIGTSPNVYITSPKLKLATGEKDLPHVYSTKRQWLCIYYRRALEWKSNMTIADSIIPWTSEWLFFYEIWLGTGKWLGGGVHTERITEQQKIDQND